MYVKYHTFRRLRVSGVDAFQARFYAARTHIDKIKLCIREGRYKISTRRDKPNLNGAEYLQPILELPSGYSCKVKSPRLSGGHGLNYVIDFEYKAMIMGAELKMYFKGYYGTNVKLTLVVQSLRFEKED